MLTSTYLFQTVITGALCLDMSRYGYVALPMSSMQCDTGCMVTFKYFDYIIRLDENAQLRQKILTLR